MAEPFDMEGRYNLLPLKDSNPGSPLNKREWAVPGVIAGMLNAASVPGRAAQGENIQPQEALNLAMNMTGGGLMSPKPTGVLGMGGGRIHNITQMKLQRVQLERETLNDMAKKLLPKLSDLRAQRHAIEMGLNTFAKRTIGQSDDQIRFALGKEQYQVYSEMRKALKDNNNMIMELEKTYGTMRDRYTRLYDDMQRLMGVVSDSQPNLKNSRSLLVDTLPKKE